MTVEVQIGGVRRARLDGREGGPDRWCGGGAAGGHAPVSWQCLGPRARLFVWRLDL